MSDLLHMSLLIKLQILIIKPKMCYYVQPKNTKETYKGDAIIINK